MTVLTLLAPLAPASTALYPTSGAHDYTTDVFASDWRTCFAQAGPSATENYAAPDYDDTHWEYAHLPYLLRRGTHAQDTLWYRAHATLTPPPEGEHILLRFGGAFYSTDVWLNGTHLGTHTGYFQPFGFDITAHVRAGDNVLAVCCHFPIEADRFKRKTAITGVFADWDCKPYPSTLYPNLPDNNTWLVPLGLWQPVTLHTQPSLLITRFIVYPHFTPAESPQGDPAPAFADVHVHVTIHNLSASPHTTAVHIALAPTDAPTELTQRAWPLTLAAHETRTEVFTLRVMRPRLWWPWTHGTPTCYAARLTLGELTSTRTFGIRTIELEADRTHGWHWRLNGRRIFPKGSNYIADFYLDQITPDGLARDVALARAANLDFLRVHGHIAPAEFYRQCDEQGLLVMCDFPLIWTYAYDLAPEAAAAFHAEVLRQASHMVGLLGSHPSIALWSLHNEPPWTPDGSFLGTDVHTSATNQASDRAAAALVRTLDPTRPAQAASGEHDQHLYHGWYTGAWLDNRTLSPTFPTEFGVQALPSLNSPFWTTVNTAWPVETDDPSWAHAGYQSVFWISPGVGAPAHYATLAAYIAESQAYQAFYIRYVIDQWRRQKFAPTGGYVHFLFTDAWPAITWSVLDYYRHAKSGYAALAEASRAVRLCLDIEPTFSVERAFHLVYPAGGRLRVGLALVNDDYRLSGNVIINCWLERRGWPHFWHAPGNALRQARAHRRFVPLPRADEGAHTLDPLDWALPRTGEYVLRTRVTLGTRTLDENELAFRVGAPQVARHNIRHVPGILVRKVYVAGSLRHTPDGFTFGVRNIAMPVVATAFENLRLDGQPIDPAHVEVVFGGYARHANTITPETPIEFPSGETFTVLVRGHPLVPGQHEIEVTACFVGLGEVSAKIKDRLA